LRREGGLVSQIFKGPSRHTTSATTVLFQGMPATRMGSTSLQNLTSCTGGRLVPSQTNRLIEAP
jgi:hypothetical protein